MFGIIGSRVLDEPNYYYLVQHTVGIYFNVGSKGFIANYKKYVDFCVKKTRHGSNWIETYEKTSFFKAFIVSYLCYPS